MLGLGQQVGRDPLRIRRVVSYDQAFGRPRERLDADLAEDHALGQDDEEIARADDLVHARERFGAIRQPGDRLGAADAIDRINFRDARRGQQDIGDLAVRAAGRRREHDLAHASYTRGDRGHEHAAGIGRAPPRRIHRHAVERADELAERAAGGRVVEPRFAAAVLVEGADTVGGGLQRAHHRLANVLDGLVDPGGADAQFADLGVVEGTREVAQCRIAARADVLDDALDDCFGTEIFAERLADPRAHTSWQRPRVDRHQPAPNEQRRAPACSIRKTADHARASHGSRSIANSPS